MQDDSSGSVTWNLRQWQTSRDDQAAQALYERYIRQLVGMARHKLPTRHQQVNDAEDIAHVAMNCFFQGSQDGRFPLLRDRDDLWQVLVTIVKRKTVDAIRREQADKRGARRTIEFSQVAAADREADAGVIEQAMQTEVTPEFAAEVKESLGQRLAKLSNDDLRAIAIHKMDGRTNQEIAQVFQCHVRTIERQLSEIRKLWTETH